MDGQYVRNLVAVFALQGGVRWHNPKWTLVLYPLCDDSFLLNVSIVPHLILP